MFITRLGEIIIIDAMALDSTRLDLLSRIFALLHCMIHCYDGVGERYVVLHRNVTFISVCLPRYTVYDT